MITIASEVKRLHQRAGRCVSCDEPLPPPKAGRTPGGRKKSLLCGDEECERVYLQLYHSVRCELIQMALEMRGAAKAIARANRSLRSVK